MKEYIKDREHTEWKQKEKDKADDKAGKIVNSPKEKENLMEKSKPACSIHSA